MINLFRKKRKRERIVLSDLQGSPYKFYRGKDYKYLSGGCYFCSCFDIAQSYRLSDTEPIIETEIAVSNPLVIDATIEGGYSYYERLCIRDCILHPEHKRDDLIQYLSEVGARNTLSSDEVLTWAQRTKDIDAVIIKNVREGINSEFPIYDVMIWDENNLVNPRNVENDSLCFEKFRTNTFKRIDLSSYISEHELDGIVGIIYEDGFHIEQEMLRNGTNWALSYVLVVKTDTPIQVFESTTNRYITANPVAPGVYSNTYGMSSLTIFQPNNGTIRLKNIVPQMKYIVINTAPLAL